MRTQIKILILLLLIGISSKSQSPTGFPTVNAPAGYYNIGWLRSDSGNIVATNSPTFTPKYFGTEITYVNPGVDTSLWVWVGRWVKELKAGDVPNLTATLPIVYNAGNISCPTCGTGGGGITSLNGLTSITQTFSTGTTGSDFNISSVGSVHTFNFPTASAFNRGLLGTSDFTSFASKQPQLNGTGFVKATGTTISYDNSTYYLASNPTNFVTLGSFSALAPALYNNTTGVHSVDTTTGLTHLATQAFVLANQTSGTITGAGNLVPLFTTTVSSNTLVFALTNAAANSILGRNSGSTGAPAYFVPALTNLNTWAAGSIALLGTGNTWTGLQTFGTLTTTSTTKMNGLLSGGINDSIVTWNPSTFALGVTSRNFSLFAVQGLGSYGTSGDSIGIGLSPFFQPDTLRTAGFPFLITGLPNAVTGGGDSAVNMHANGQLFKSPVPAGSLFSGPVASTVMTDPSTGLLTTLPIVVGQPVRLATVIALSPGNTYSNGTGGVGATLTAVSNAALSVDGVAVATGDSVLVKNEASPSHNGPYRVTQTGSGGTPYILTRLPYASIATNLASMTSVGVQAGNTQTNQVFYQTTTGPIIIGTTSLVYAREPLPQAGIGAGSCTNCTLTLDGQGRVTNYSTGTGGSGGGIGLDSTVTITSGSSSTVTNGFNIVRFNATAPISTYTLTLPTTWHTSNDLLIAFTANGAITNGMTMVTTLIVVNGSGQTLSQAVAPSTGTAGEVIRFHLIGGTIDQRTN